MSLRGMCSTSTTRRSQLTAAWSRPLRRHCQAWVRRVRWWAFATCFKWIVGARKRLGIPGRLLDADIVVIQYRVACYRWPGTCSYGNRVSLAARRGHNLARFSLLAQRAKGVFGDAE